MEDYLVINMNGYVDSMSPSLTYYTGQSYPPLLPRIKNFKKGSDVRSDLI